MENSNESAVSFAWLADRLGLVTGKPGRTKAVWQGVRDQMRRTDQIFASSQDWISDFWLCKATQINPLGIVPKWDPPDDLDEWTTLDIDLSSMALSAIVRLANHAAFERMLAGVKEVPGGGTDAAVLQFYELDQATRVPGDLAMLQAQHVRAWLATAFGNLLMSIALSPQSYHEQLVVEARRRLLIPRQLKAAPMWGVQFAEGELGLLYNCRQSPQGSLSWRGIRVGQGEEWMKHWQWLSSPLLAEQTLPAVQLAAQLMRCTPLLEALLSTLDSGDSGLVHLALAVLRRWLLSLKAMAWLEEALVQSWKVMRPQDLTCFAFNALKPEWPHRSVAVSHRSMDVKPTLQTTRAWKSSLFAIDANYAPSWETNTGMIWGLFAATPVLARIQSENYAGSEWCLREAELIQYLADQSDFLMQRHIVDVRLEQLSDLDRLIAVFRPSTTAQNAPLFLEFPPLFSVYAPSAAQEWELRMLRAAGALRVLSAVYGSADLANKICIALQSSDAAIPVPPPTNNPDGWNAFRKVFRDLQAECGPASASAPLLFPQGYPEDDPEVARQFADAIPDLSRGAPSIEDMLAALEWQTILLPLAQDVVMREKGPNQRRDRGGRNPIG